ncbi:phosphate ABC transporter permease [Paenibacillus sp. E194]|jgi:phosphate transport system permease protein|uniref:Phosphate transport system permease protein n=3 Tax=Paenibacillus TaxID=44249 RepID=A0AAJ2JV81_9BACL|nr:MULTISPECIES: phosphate ABC transporter permease subunit PstC [Paenibacillus]EPY14874.1 phosphate ABC transporter inner membrane subunit PstC [Paenibacillus alvei A6-6i-x]KJB88514.1 phosphate ABC transporter permease [Paenibacillus sp. E194]MCM3289980.1 phosphate ABC transporter permease subunit PstC [Paenibacillus sp. MER 180]MCY9528131.1 phosphate ABC transporter permease subunit PstC [Paenibacillus alvei]MDT8975485.1 phosphate ABC transporter permease subunit PstC [Paenibacillus sp. chi1
MQGNLPQRETTISFKNGKVHVTDKIVPILLFLCAALSVATTIGIVYTLFSETFSFLKQVKITEFLFGTTWSPLISPKSFGILPLLGGTLMITVIACLVAIPIGLASAIYLSEYAPTRVRKIVKPILEVLAGIPTIVYGYFALTFVTPLLKFIFPSTGMFNALSAGLVVGIMIIPMVSSLSEDAMSAVPRSLRNGAYALGATRFEVALKIVVPAAFSGIVSSAVLAFSRAIGETMIVTIAAGATPHLTWNPLESIQTMTAYIVQVSMGDTPHGSIEYGTIFAVGMTLFVITFLLNILALWVARRFREEY